MKIAEDALRAHLTEPGWRFVAPTPAHAGAARLSLRAHPDPDAPQVTEALPGEHLELLWENAGGWAYVRTTQDRYLGWARADGLHARPWQPDLTVTARDVQGAPVNVTRIPSLDTPLAAAIRTKQDKIAAFLLRNGADMGLRLAQGQTPLHLAIARACPLTVKQLLDAGADPNTPFNLPVSDEFLKCVRPGVLRWVLKYDRGVTPLMLAADSGAVGSARALIQAGAKTGVRTRATDIWPINFASRRSDVRMMRLFLGRDPLREERRIEIRLSEQRARVYDATGNEIFNTKVSTGKKGHDTPTGEYVITNKYRDWNSTLYHASMPYFQRLSCGDFGLHQGNVPDYPASHGCIRVPAGNAQKLFLMTQSGDRVNIIP